MRPDTEAKMKTEKVNRQDSRTNTSNETRLKLLEKELIRLTEVILVILLCPIYWTLICIVLLTFFLPCFLYRFLVIKACAYLHPSWHRVSVQDNMLGEDFITTKPNAVITVVATINDPLPLDEYRKKYNDTIVQLKNPKTGKYLFPKYMQYHERWFGYNFWKWDTDFNIENHIKILEGTENNEYTTEEQLMELLGKALNRGFQPKRPHWDILIAENFIPKDSATPTIRKTAYIFRIHHGIADGYSLLKSYVEHMCREKNVKGNIVVPKFDTPKVHPLVKLWNGFYTVASLPHTLGMQKLIEIDSNIWFKSEKHLTKNLLASRSKRISVEDIKSIRRKYNVSFNAVLYTVLAGGMRKYFRLKYLENDSVGVPEFLRSFAPFPWKNHPNNKLLNHWTCAVVPILTGIECPVERLYKTEAEFGKVKSSAAPLANYVSISMCGLPPTWFVKQLGTNSFSTAIVSIFPGPTHLIKFFGETDVDDQSFWAPHLRGNAGIGVGICSYKESVRIAISVDAAIISRQSDLEDLLQFIEEEVEILAALSGVQETHEPPSILKDAENFNGHVNGNGLLVHNNNEATNFGNQSFIRSRITSTAKLSSNSNGSMT